MAVDIYDVEIAEALLYYVQQADVFEDMCQKAVEYDFSIAEYVHNFRYSDFQEWFEKNYT